MPTTANQAQEDVISRFLWIAQMTLQSDRVSTSHLLNLMIANEIQRNTTSISPVHLFDNIDSRPSNSFPKTIIDPVSNSNMLYKMITNCN